MGATARRRRPAAIQGRRALAGGAILLVRVTYEIFAAFWPTAPKDEGFSDRMNDIPKYVVSKTLESPSWRNSTVIRDDPVEAIIDLKQEPSGNILLYGSGDLLNSLIGHDVIDEYRIMVFPVLLGSGKRCSRRRATRRTWGSSTGGRSSRGSPGSLGSVSLRGVPGEWGALRGVGHETAALIACSREPSARPEGRPRHGANDVLGARFTR